MAIKRKTHLNLSGSHHTLDSDNAFVGGTIFVTGSVKAKVGANETTLNSGSLTYSGGVFGDRLLIEAQTANLDLVASGVGKKIRLQSNTDITGSLIVSGGLTGSLSGTLSGLPFLVSGGNMGGVNYNADTGQWEITGSSGTSVAGVNTQVQFNADGVHGASSELTFNTSSVGSLAAYTLSAPTGSLKVLSGSNADNLPLYGGDINSPYLLINSATVVTQSLLILDNTPLFAVNGGNLQVATGSFSGDSFEIKPNQAGNGTIDLIYRDPDNNQINLRPLYVTMSAVSTDGIVGTELSGGLLDNGSKGTVAKVDFSVLAASGSSDFASWTFSVTTRRDNIAPPATGTYKVLSITEIDSVTDGTVAASWDVNVNNDGKIQCTGSAGDTVRWYAKVSNKMILDSSATPMIVY